MAKPPSIKRILPGAAKVAIRGVPIAGEAAMAVDGTLQAVQVMKEQRAMDKRLRERRRESQGFRAKALSVLDATKERVVQQLTGTARIAAAAFTGVRTNPEMQDNGTLAAMYRNLESGEIEVVLYDTSKLERGASAAFVGYILANCRALASGAPVNGCHWRVEHAAARRGYGPLLYSLTATMLRSGLYPSLTLSADARRFWRRQDKDYIEPLLADEFRARFGVSVLDLLKRSTATRAQGFDLRQFAQREVARVYGTLEAVDEFESTEKGMRLGLSERRRWELNDDQAPLKYINEEAQEYARDEWRRQTADNPSDVKRRLAQTVVQAVRGMCPVCGKTSVTAADVFAIPGTSGNSPGKVAILCAGCRATSGARPRPASDAIAGLAVKPQGTLFEVRAPLRISTRTEEDREKARSGERVKWAGWTHLERRIQERVAPHAARSDVQAFVRSVGQVLQDAIPPRVRIGERDSLLLRIGDYGGVHLSPLPEDGALLWGTWFPPDSSWYPRASEDTWALTAAQKIARLVDALKATRLRENPLDGWDSGHVRPSEVHSLFRILTGPRSQAYYAEALRNVPFNLHVVVVPPGEGEDLYDSGEEGAREPSLRVRELARRAKQVVLYVGTNLEKDYDVGEKWAPEREARYTPFMLLHRLFDTVYVSSQLVEQHRALRDKLLDIAQTAFQMQLPRGAPRTQAITYEDTVHWFPQHEMRTRASAVCLGVDTAAGRNNACADGEQVLADLFAKYCMTGRIAFDPYALPPGVTQAALDRSDRDDLKKLRYWMQVRADAKQSMKVLFDELIAILQKGDAFFI